MINWKFKNLESSDHQNLLDHSKMTTNNTYHISLVITDLGVLRVNMKTFHWWPQHSNIHVIVITLHISPPCMPWNSPFSFQLLWQFLSLCSANKCTGMGKFWLLYRSHCFLTRQCCWGVVVLYIIQHHFLWHNIHRNQMAGSAQGRWIVAIITNVKRKKLNACDMSSDF